MTLRKLLLVLQNQGTPYYQGVLDMFGADLVSYWPQWELSGTAAEDIKGDFNGAYTGVTLNQTGIGDGKGVPYYGGSARTNLLTTPLNDAFIANPDEFTFWVWAKPNTADVWTDSTQRYILYLYADANNYLRIYKHPTNNYIYIEYMAGGTSTSVYTGVLTGSGWRLFGVSVSKSANRLTGYYNGAIVANAELTVGTWNGAALTKALLGVYNTSNNYPWVGWIGPAGWLNRACTLLEMQRLYRLNPSGGANTQPGYFTVGDALVTLVQDQPWQDGPPHTLSVLELNSGGYKYWGWYGLPSMTGGPIGIVRSNDLVTWDQHPSNPIIASGRWPQVVKIGTTFYMALTKYNGETTLEYIDLLSSADGVTWATVKTIVGESAGLYTDNPYLFINPNDGLIYFYYMTANKTSGDSIVYVRVAATITDLDAATPIVIFSTPCPEAPHNVASPSMMYHDGLYYLCVETTMTGEIWGTLAYASNSPTGGFVQLWNSPILTNDEACFFQFKFGDLVVCPTGHRLDGATWTLDVRTIGLTQARPQG